MRVKSAVEAAVSESYEPGAPAAKTATRVKAAVIANDASAYQAPLAQPLNLGGELLALEESQLPPSELPAFKVRNGLAVAVQALEPPLVQEASAVVVSQLAKVDVSLPKAVTAETRALPLVPQWQGNTNACGTTALAAVMTYWGQPTTHEVIDEKIRSVNQDSAPDLLVKYARDHGLRTELKNEATLGDLTAMVDQGVAPMVLVHPPANARYKFHYLTVTGYSRGADGSPQTFTVADSQTGTKRTYSAAAFSEIWNTPSAQGLTRLMISSVPDDNRLVKGTDGIERTVSSISLPKSGFMANLNGLPARVADLGFSNVVNGIKQRNAGDVLGGGIQLATGSFGIALRKFGSPVLDRAAGAISYAGNAAGRAVQAVGNAASNAVRRVGRSIGRVFGW